MKEGVTINTLFARQPILNLNKELYGYELLFRSTVDATKSNSPSFDADKATASVLESFFGKIKSITDGKKAFVNFTENLILNDVPKMFSNEYLVIEVLEDIEPSEANIDALNALKVKGYTIAIDDFVYNDKFIPFLKIADIVKLEVSGIEDNIIKTKRHIDKRCLLLAEKVETQEEFNLCKRLGCHLFQGYFFAKPITVSKPALEILKVNYIRLISESNKKEIDYEEIAKIIKQDIGLSYRLLKLVNSVYFSARSEIKDIKRAIVHIGEAELKKWISFVTLSEVCSDKSTELMKMSLIRAKFCEDFAEKIQSKDKDFFFLTGLFSLLDVMMEIEMEELLNDLSLSQDIKDALLGKDNIYGDILSLMKSLETGDWELESKIASKFNIEDKIVIDIYYKSIEHCNKLFTI